MASENKFVPTQDSLEPAVTARRVLMFEVHSLADCKKLVYEPVRQALAELARTRPRKLVCLNSIEYARQKDEDPEWIDIDLITHTGAVLYMGTALTRPAAIKEWYRRCKTLRKHHFKSHLELLAWHGAKGVMVDRMGCTIPVSADALSLGMLAKAAETYLRRVCPELSFLPIEWVADEVAAECYDRIYYAAKHQAAPQTEEEKSAIVLEEYDAL